MDKTKTCKTCKVVKPETDFNIDRVQRDGRRATCKQCRSVDDDWKPDPTRTKTCKTCKDEKPETHFRVNRIQRDGLRSTCKQCSTVDDDWKPDPTRTKKCFTCKDEKPETHFHIDRAQRDGLASSCRLCSAYNIHKSKAKSRKLETSLTKEEFMSLVLQPCDYCKTGYTNETVQLNGIDRVDNTVGYHVGNCIPCCYECNVFKKDYTEDQLITFCTNYLNKTSISAMNKIYSNT